MSLAIFGNVEPKAHWGHDLDLLGSHDVIGHVISRFPIGHFLSVVLWNRASVSSGFWDIGL